MFFGAVPSYCPQVVRLDYIADGRICWVWYLLYAGVECSMAQHLKSEMFRRQNSVEPRLSSLVSILSRICIDVKFALRRNLGTAPHFTQQHCFFAKGVMVEFLVVRHSTLDGVGKASTEQDWHWELRGIIFRQSGTRSHVPNSYPCHM